MKLRVEQWERIDLKGMLMVKKRVISAGVVVPRLAANGDVEVLLQLKRKYNEWEFPGGKLDGTEETIQTARRELVEETGIQATSLEFVTYIDHGDKYCCLMFVARKWHGTPSLVEPDKHSVLGWFPLYDLPKPLTKAAEASIWAGALRPLYEEAKLTADEVEFSLC